MAATAKRRTQAERREAGQRALIESSIACLSEKGFAATTFHDIVKRANCTTGQIQHHFGSKYGLYIAVLNQLLEEFEAAFDAFPDNSRDLASRVGEAIRILVGLYTSDRYAAVYTLVLGGQHDPELKTLIAQQRRGALATTRRAWLETFSDTGCPDEKLFALLEIVVGVLRDFHFNKTVDIADAKAGLERNICLTGKMILAELSQPDRRN